MPPLDSSPLPLRLISMAPRSPSHSSPFGTDADELNEATIPCSPVAFLPPYRGAATQSAVTQPTQILSRPGLNRETQERSSSPALVEVPASSPFRSPAPPARKLGSRLAPAGTFFRPPPKQVPAKRPVPDYISLVSDDEDNDSTPPRGEIKPTTFRAQISAYRYDATNEEANRTKLRQIYDVHGDKFPALLVKKALRQCNYDVEDASDWLTKHGQKYASISHHGNSQPSKPAPSNHRTATVAAQRRPQPSTPPKPKRRRLMQGLKQRSSPATQQAAFQPPPPSSDDPLVINLVDNDQDDAFKVESSPEPSEDGDARILDCINTSTVKNLAAMTGLKETQLEIIVNRAPFAKLDDARAVTITKSSGRSRMSRDEIGETVVRAVEVFLHSVDAIDQVVAKCEAKAKLVKDVIDGWDLDSFGHSKLGKSAIQEKDLPPTPTSERDSKLSRPPIPDQPAYFDGHCQMKPFQLFGLNWMSLLHTYDIGCILADDMGLGKTCQVISFVANLVETYKARQSGDRPWPNLIVVPPSTYDNWLAEFAKFAPGLSVIGYRGSQAERSEIAYEVADSPESYHAVVATYTQLKSEEDIEAMQSIKLHTAIFDEGHLLKNPDTERYRFLRRIQASWKMLLTGTPVQNNLLEMIALLSFINPRMFEGCMDHIIHIFKQKVTVRDVGNGAFLYRERVERARNILAPFLLQRSKDQVLSDMPQKINTIVNCDMTAIQKEAYDEYESAFRQEPGKKKQAATKGRGNDQNNPWIQLRKAALHPLLFRRHFTDEMAEEMAGILMDNVDQDILRQPVLKHLVQELKNCSDFELHLWCRDFPKLLGKFDVPSDALTDSGKVNKLLELIAQYRENGDRVLVFSKFSSVIRLLNQVLDNLDIPALVLAGETAVSDRQDLINEFNQNQDIPVFLLTTGAGGTGINLTAANKVVIFDQSDNPQDDVQAENRAHRLGQTRDVEIVRLLSTGTVEGLIHEACRKKLELAKKVTGSGTAEMEDDENMETRVRKMMKEQLTPP